VPKLTEKERATALYALKSRLTSALEQTPKGVTDREMRAAINEVLISMHLIPAKP